MQSTCVDGLLFFATLCTTASHLTKKSVIMYNTYVIALLPSIQYLPNLYVVVTHLLIFGLMVKALNPILVNYIYNLYNYITLNVLAIHSYGNTTL